MPQLYPQASFGAPSAAAPTGGASSRTSYVLSPATDGTTTEFTVQGTVAGVSIDLFNNLGYQIPGTHYTLDSSGAQYVVTMTYAPAAGDVLTAVY